MSADTPARLALLRELRDEILLHYGTGRPAVAVDGLAGSGTDRFADDLAATFAERGHAVVRADLSGFRATREEAPVGAATGAADYAEWFDADAFRDAIATPFRRGDADLPAAGGATGVAADAVLLVDGPFLLQPALVGLWNYSVFVEVPREVAAERTAGDADAPSADVQRAYVGAIRPRTRAIAIVDNTDADAPVRRYADSC